MPETRILLIEDEATSRELLSYVLSSAGYAVDAVETAAAAMTNLEATAYKVVIADWLLPDGNGIDLADRAAQLGAKTFIVSGYLIGLPAGAAERHILFKKPVRPEELVAAVEQAMNSPNPPASSP
jgi:DNA-binding response OmpR family regulator